MSANSRRFGLALLAAALLGACSYHPEAPKEFAVYPRGTFFKGPLKAVSPDGVIFTVRQEYNKPRADLGFWREAMKTRMGQAGYRVVSDTVIAMKGGEGALLKLAAPVGNQDYLYWIAFTMCNTGHRIVVAEAAGEAKKFLARQQEIIAAISASGF